MYEERYKLRSLLEENIMDLKTKCILVKNFAPKIDEQFTSGRITEIEALEKLAEFAKINNLAKYWFDIDNELRKKYECSDWFWLVRRLRNCSQYLKE